MLTKTRAVVLHHVKYGESSILLYCYTEQFGRMNYMVHGVRSKKPKFPSSTYQPLTVLDIIFYYKPNRSLHLLKEMSCPLHYSSIPFNASKSCIAIFIAEVLYKTLHEEESNPGLFHFLLNSFHILDVHEQGTANFHITFLLHYTKFLGIYPEGLLNKSRITGQADLHVFYDLQPNEMDAVIKMLQSPDFQLTGMQLNNQSRSVILERLIQYYNMHLDGILKLKSLAVLKEVFN